jgi:hypothetical protein
MCGRLWVKIQKGSVQLYRGGQFYWQMETHRPAANYLKIVSDNVVSSSPSLSKIRTQNVTSCDTVCSRIKQDLISDIKSSTTTLCM